MSGNEEFFKSIQAKENKLKRISEVMGLVSHDMENDVKNFEGKPFNGRTLGEAHGQLCAAVQAVAKALKQIVDEELLK